MDKRIRRRRWAVGVAALAAGALVAILPIPHADAAPTTSRISGADRFETAAAISKASFAVGVPVAYVATGVDFPDALAAAPAAAKGGGPVLLTNPTALPSSTATELTRLKPGKIIVIGGTGSVSAAVMTGLQSFTTGTVTRLQGNDRYQTAAAISNATFAASTNTVYVASGQGFADALAGGPAAANATGGGAPLLLVQKDALPASTATELQRLNAQTVIVLGGTSSVSDGVVAALDPYSVNPVLRRAGTDRYLTSVAISSATFASATKVYLATGINFPDALAGGPAAGVAKGPVLLTERGCIPAAVNAEITRLNPSQLIILGGTSSIADTVLSRNVCPIVDPPITVGPILQAG